tara:strand:+ start:1262 stop:2290 length:1029 start_codon:yes stop_codon:yes gene_type:complete
MTVEATPALTATPDTPTVAEGSQTLDTASNLLFGNPSPNLQTTPPTQPNYGQAQEAPVIAEGDGTGKPAEGTAAAPIEGQANAEATDEDVLAAMSPTETPEQTLARTKREAGASREEALRLKKVDEGTREVLKNQGLDIVTDDSGKVIGVAPNDKYNGGKSEEMMALKFTEMTEAQQTLFESDPQALINHVLNHAQTGMVRVAPTVEKPFASISLENEQVNFDHVAGLVLEDGETKKHPNLALNKAIIHQNINAPSNTALKAFYNQQPDLALSLLDSYVDKTRSLLAQKAQLLIDAKTNKKQEADATLSPAPGGGGAPVITAANASPEEVGAAWGKSFALAE